MQHKKRTFLNCEPRKRCPKSKQRFVYRTSSVASLQCSISRECAKSKNPKSRDYCICRVTLLIPRAPSNFGPMFITLLFYQCEVHHLSVLSPLQEPRTYLKWRLAVTQIHQYIYRHRECSKKGLQGQSQDIYIQYFF